MCFCLIGCLSLIKRASSSRAKQDNILIRFKAQFSDNTRKHNSEDSSTMVEEAKAEVTHTLNDRAQSEAWLTENNIPFHILGSHFCSQLIRVVE